MPASGSSAKLVLTGPMAAGKTTAIRAITDGEPITTEMPVSEGAIEGKTTTTVAMDYSTVMLEGDTELMVYGLPGQEHFAFMRPIVLQGAFGVIVLLDGRGSAIAAECESWLKVAAEFAPDAALAVGVTHTDLMDEFSLTPIRQAACCLGWPVPVFTVDARSRQQTLHLLRALLVSAGSQLTGRAARSGLR